MTSHYKTLGVTSDASYDVIKSAFRELAKRHHPDVGGDEEKFKTINDAYRVLSDPHTRAEYDRSQIKPSFKRDFDFHVKKSFNIRTTVNVSLQSIVRNQTVIIRVNSGTGLKDVSVNIPMGVHSGAIICYKGMGYSGDYGPPGDLLVEIMVDDDPRFTRDGNDIVGPYTIDCFDALLGKDVMVHTVSGTQIMVKIPAGTQHGKTFRVVGHGLPDNRTGKFGDHMVQIYVSVPTNLSTQEIEHLQRIKEIRSKR